jgi:hypothetical protein
MTDNDKKLHQLTEGVTRIANYMEEILKLVRADQERSRKYMEDTAAFERQAKG